MPPSAASLPVDTIVALSTPSGRGALAVVRISGPGAGAVLAAVTDREDLEPRRATLVTVRHPATGEVADRVLATWFPGPASYTGEDVVELSGHGGVVAPALVVEACREAGARPAEPGEFTRRAYLHGKLDLIQAEAVLDLVEGGNRALHRAALHQLDRGLSERLASVRAGLVELEGLLVHHLDFPDEDDPPVPMERIVRRAGRLSRELRELADTAPEGRLLRDGALAVLAGRPNVGKSSLLNALAGEERVIVTEVPGTTRDAVEVGVSMAGYPFRVVDTAGLRESGDRVEREGIEVARRYLRGADVVVYCLEAGAEPEPTEAAFLEGVEAPVVRVRTKADLVPDVAGRGSEEDGVPVSARTGVGLDRLRELLAETVYACLRRRPEGVPVVTRERQRRALEEAVDAVGAFARAASDGVPAEAASAHLKSAASALEEVVGVVTGDEVLDHVFREFCIGK